MEVVFEQSYSSLSCLPSPATVIRSGQSQQLLMQMHDWNTFFSESCLAEALIKGKSSIS